MNSFAVAILPIRATVLRLSFATSHPPAVQKDAQTVDNDFLLRNGILIEVQPKTKVAAMAEAERLAARRERPFTV
ncbi:hypothetical protein HFO60_04545 [Rhizobium leguminosarum]|uniref:hypothetical protein n=1 Tax=Rhizobium leguminosarum TaxID=384 RepID=UPI001C984B53|nr:hypothetical protein [Rhizobium leguminosarum]MBY5539320.1 hypothetical protein [Rhizobium leguminosarum]